MSKNSFIRILLMLGTLSSPSCFAIEDYWKAEEYYHNSSSQKDAAAELIKHVTIRKEAKILDVGCGDGKITAEIAAIASSGSVVGVDISPAMIAFAKETFPQNHFSSLEFFIKDAEQLDFNKEFDSIFSFTTLQWIQNHDAFLKGAHRSLKSHGTLAVTMPIGLPPTLQQAVNELMISSEWSSYFNEFSTGWNFVNEVQYKKLLASNRFIPIRVAAVPQRDIFPSRVAFEKFISQWFPYLRPLPQDLKPVFLQQVINRFLELEAPFPNGEVHFKIRRLEVVAIKP
jgi:trans-aconitate methyltransferase